jgi:hypothetical protein
LINFFFLSFNCFFTANDFESKTPCCKLLLVLVVVVLILQDAGSCVKLLFREDEAHGTLRLWAGLREEIAEEDEVDAFGSEYVVAAKVVFGSEE